MPPCPILKSWSSFMHPERKFLNLEHEAQTFDFQEHLVFIWKHLGLWDHVKNNDQWLRNITSKHQTLNYNALSVWQFRIAMLSAVDLQSAGREKGYSPDALDWRTWCFLTSSRLRASWASQEVSLSNGVESFRVTTWRKWGYWCTKRRSKSFGSPKCGARYPNFSK